MIVSCICYLVFLVSLKIVGNRDCDNWLILIIERKYYNNFKFDFVLYMLYIVSDKFLS